MARKQITAASPPLNFMILALTGADDDSLPAGGFASIPPGDSAILAGGDSLHQSL